MKRKSRFFVELLELAKQFLVPLVNILVALTVSTITHVLLTLNSSELEDMHRLSFLCWLSDAILFILFSLVASVIAPYIKQFFANRKFKKSRLCQTLQNYVDEVVASNEDLRIRVKHAVINLSDDGDMFQGHSSFRRNIYISHSWIVAAMATTEGLEMAKTTICHELGHLLDNSYDNLLGYGIANMFKLLTPKGKLLAWEKEYTADYYGAIFYGNKEMYLHKMRFMKNMYEFEEPTELRDHPTWRMRIRAIENGNKLSKHEVKEAFDEFQEYLKK